MTPNIKKDKVLKEFISTLSAIDRIVNKIINDLHYIGIEFAKRAFPELTVVFSEEEFNYFADAFQLYFLLEFLNIYTLKVGNIIKDEKAWDAGIIWGKKIAENVKSKEEIVKTIEGISILKKKMEEMKTKEAEKYIKKYGYYPPHSETVFNTTFFDAVLTALNDYLNEDKNDRKN